MIFETFMYYYSTKYNQFDIFSYEVDRGNRILTEYLNILA